MQSNPPAPHLTRPVSFVCTAAFVPYAPGKPYLKGRTDALLTVKWAPARDNGHPVDKYEVQMAKQNDGRWVSASDVVPDTSHLITDLQPVTSYCFRVRAHNLLGWGAFSENSDFFRTMRRF